MQRLLFYVSGHGFGHATRSRALIAELLRRRGDALEIHVRTDAPHWIFQERDADVHCSHAAIDVGILQRTGMDVDLASSLAAHLAFVGDWERRADDEARFVEALAPSLVVADLPPLAFAAAARAGVPSLGVANFSWDWIAARYAADDPRWTPIADRYADAYASAERVYRLPLHSDFSAFREVVDVPFLVNRSQRSRAECRLQLGVAKGDTRPMVLVSFGGFGVGRVAGGADEDLSAYRFAMIGEPPAGIPGVWTPLPSPSPLPHEDLMQACDAVMGKTGYGTVSEALAHATRFLYLPRAGFPEVPLLESGLERLGCARAMSRGDFEAGRWRPHLEALFEKPPPPPPPACDGAERIANALIAGLDD